MDKIKNRKRKIKVALCLAYLNTLKNRQKRRCWVKAWMQNRNKYGHMPLINELRDKFPMDFKNYLRMDAESFRILLNLVAKKDTRMRESITVEERLTATLRYLATGRSFENLKFSTGVSASALCKIIPETCKAIYEVLKKTHLKFPSTKEEWLEIANGFKQKWQFINCGGALDGKHIRIVPPPRSGAQYYNYKNFYSIVLMALVNSNYEFIFVDIGKNGRLSDGGVIETTEFYHKLVTEQLNLPTNEETEHQMIFVFLGDEAFALNEHLLKPFPQRDLFYNKRIFNYRLSRARNVSENAIGLIAAPFRILHTPIHMAYPENINYVILAICALHNFLRKRDTSYTSSTAFDHENLVSHELHWMTGWMTGETMPLK